VTAFEQGELDATEEVVAVDSARVGLVLRGWDLNFFIKKKEKKFTFHRSLGKRTARWSFLEEEEEDEVVESVRIEPEDSSEPADSQVLLLQLLEEGRVE
jgi:hypothetical protein